MDVAIIGYTTATVNALTECIFGRSVILLSKTSAISPAYLKDKYRRTINQWEHDKYTNKLL